MVITNKWAHNPVRLRFLHTREFFRSLEHAPTQKDSISGRCRTPVPRLGQRPYIIERTHSYTLPKYCLSGLHLSLLTGGTAVCGHS